MCVYVWEGGGGSPVQVCPVHHWRVCQPPVNEGELHVQISTRTHDSLKTRPPPSERSDEGGGALYAASELTL